MRAHGTLAKWNEERGFGFIKPAEGGGDLFAHITAFPRDGAKPKIGETVSFEIETTPEGKKRAVRIWRTDESGRAVFTLEPMRPRPVRTPAAPRPASHTYSARREPDHRHARRGSGMQSGVVMAVLISLGVFGYSKISSHSSSSSGMKLISEPAPGSTRTPARDYHCDGRQHCSQMNSYEEAKWFLDHCPNMKMDGDGDGIPCESQF